VPEHKRTTCFEHEQRREYSLKKVVQLYLLTLAILVWIWLNRHRYKKNFIF